jgi:tripartite-type tricarboxylate transporter receptor subunit TctC
MGIAVSGGESMFMRTMRAGVLLAALFVTAGACAAEQYPDRPIRLVAPFAPGGGADVYGRILARKFSELFSQQVVVDNRSGANGIIGTDIVAKAAPNGYTLLFAISAHVTNAAIRKDLPYDIAKDFAPVSLFTEFPLYLYANPALPVQSVAELLAMVRAKPGAFNYGSSGVGSAQHFAGEMFNAYAKTRVVHVSYKSVTAAMTDISAGAVAYSFFGPTLMPMVKVGKLKVLGVTSAKRSPAFPDVPAIQEGGVPNYHFTQWHSVLAPRYTPKPIVMRLHDAVVQATRDREIVATLNADGTELRGSTPEQTGSFIAREAEKFNELARGMSGFRVD